MAQPNMRVMRSEFAFLGKLPNRTASFGEKALRTGSMVAGFASIIPVVGMVGVAAGFALSAIANHVKAHNDKAALADWYKDQVGMQLGMDPAKVNLSDLKLAATVNPSLSRALEHIDNVKTNANTVGALGAAAGTAASFVPIPGMGLLGTKVGSAVAGLAVAGAGSKAGEVVGDWLTSSEALKDPQTIVEKIVEARNAGEVVTPIQTMMLRVAQKPELQAAIKEKMGTDYHRLAPEQQAMLMSAFPRIAAFAEKDARFIMNGGDARELMFIQPEGKWASRVARAEQGAAQPLRG